MLQRKYNKQLNKMTVGVVLIGWPEKTSVESEMWPETWRTKGQGISTVGGSTSSKGAQGQKKA